MQRKLVALSPALLKSLKKLFIFRDIPDQTLTACLTRVEEIHLLKEELIFRKGESYHKGIYFVLSGSVRMVTQSDQLDVNPGEAVGISTFLGKTMYTVTAIANSDSDIVFIDEYSIYSLMDKAPEFRERFMRVIVERLNNLERMTTRMVSLSAYQSVGGCMNSPLITLHNSKTVADAGRMMAEHNVGALVIMNRKHVLKGLLTARHLAQRYLSNAVDLPDVALAENFANPAPLMLPQEYPLVETLVEMLRRSEDYALITRKNRPAGIISKSDIMRLLANGSDVFAANVSLADSVAALTEVARSMPKIVENMMNNTSLFREILPTISSYHLLIQKRAFDLVKQDYKKKHNFELLAGRFCIVSLGSMARREMTLMMQQDHAIVLGNKLSEKERQHYTAFAKQFAATLSKIGYAHHPLGMSLNNPDMVKTVSEWQEYVSVNVHKSNETNIPTTRVLFDCDRFEGDEPLLWELRDAIYGTIKEKTLLFGRLLNYQSMAKIPISQFGSFITEKEGEFTDTIDLKENAFDFIAYTAQAFALYADILDTNSVRRLEHLARKKVISDDLAREVISAYESLVGLLLHEQLNQAGQHETMPSFRVYPAKLSMHSQEQLKRALHIVARFFGEGLAYFK